MIPLIRTEGKKFANGATLGPDKFVRLPKLERASKTQQTRKAEIELDLGESLYFFAGHACPDFGAVVLVYEPDMADTSEGSATPFDTGGLRGKHVHHNSDKPPAEYCKEHSVSLARWREAAREYISAHFASLAAYVLGEKPEKDDPTGRLCHGKNERRSWTWEIRLHRDHPIAEKLRRVWMSAEYFEDVREALRSGGEMAEACRELLKTNVIQKTAFKASPHEAAEREIAECLKS